MSIATGLAGLAMIGLGAAITKSTTEHYLKHLVRPSVYRGRPEIIKGREVVIRPNDDYIPLVESDGFIVGYLQTGSIR
jgi:hypothetical protein